MTGRSPARRGRGCRACSGRPARAGRRASARRPGAVFRASTIPASAVAARARTSRAPREPPVPRNVGDDVAVLALRGHRDVALAAVREDPAHHPLVPDRVETAFPFARIACRCSPPTSGCGASRARGRSRGRRGSRGIAAARGGIILRARMRLVADGLTRSFGARRIFGPLSFEVPEGRVLGVAGANGSGKTTLLKTLAGLIRPSGGSTKIFFEGESTGPARSRATFPGASGGWRPTSRSTAS